MPKYYCEYCGIYLTHSSPSGRKQHSHGRKHIQNKVEYYSQFLLDQGIRPGAANPFMKPGALPIGMGFNPLALVKPTGIPGGGLVVPSINLPGIMPTNITTLPVGNLGAVNLQNSTGGAGTTAPPQQFMPGMGMGLMGSGLPGGGLPGSGLPGGPMHGGPMMGGHMPGGPLGQLPGMPGGPFMGGPLPGMFHGQGGPSQFPPQQQHLQQPQQQQQ